MENKFTLTVIGKYGAYPIAGSCTSSYLVQFHNTKILLDMGSGSFARLQSLINVLELNAIFISHTHFDHISDLFVLQYYLQINNKVIDLYLPVSDNEQTRILASMKNFSLHFYADGQSERIGDMSIQLVQLFHAIDSYGMLVSSGSKTLFYSGDTTFDDKVIQLCASADVCLLDCSQPDGSVVSHMTISQGKAIADSVSARILATHLSPMVDYSEQSGELEFVDEMKEYVID